MNSTLWPSLILALFATLQVPASPYAVLLSQDCLNSPEWKQVATSLVAKHQASLVPYKDSPLEAIGRLREEFPRHVAFVAQPTEVTRQFVVDIHQLARQLDDDPYTDFFWGIVTGYNAANALAVAQESSPLTIRKAASGTELAMEMVDQGVWFCELKRNKMVRKESGGNATELKGPDDTTESLVNTLNTYHPDLFVTSGHATEHDWQIGFRHKNGYFKHQDGKLFGLDTQGQKHPVDSPNPKVYLPIGNCLMGHIDRPDCMATSWMNSAGVRQMLGYIQPTWYGYMGWGVLDYFVEQPGRYSLTEAFFANHHALVHRLLTFFPDYATTPVDTNGRPKSRPALTPQATEAALTPTDALGLLFDRDMVAFYGDPAWEARMMEKSKAFNQSLTQVDGQTYRLVITPNRGEQSFSPINTNGSQRGGRPFVAYLPHRMTNIRILSGADSNPVITDDFILVPNPLTCDPSATCEVLFQADRL